MEEEDIRFQNAQNLTQIRLITKVFWDSVGISTQAATMNLEST